MSVETTSNLDSTRDALVYSDLAETIAKGLLAGSPLRISAGSSEFEVASDIAFAIVDLLRVGSGACAVELQALPPMLTTGQAADLLDVTRPTVVKLVDEGKLPATRVGTHRRISTPDLLAFRERCRHERSEHISEIIRTSQELGLYD